MFNVLAPSTLTSQPHDPLQPAVSDNAVLPVKTAVLRQNGYVSHQPWGHGVARALEYFLDDSAPRQVPAVPQ